MMEEEARTSEQLGGRVSRGYRFQPSDLELVQHYLCPKVLGQRLPCNVIKEIEDVYGHHPSNIPLPRHTTTEDSPYFFAFLKQVHQLGRGMVHIAGGNGYWKLDGKIKDLTNKDGVVVAFKRSLVFYEYGGISPAGDLSNWMMHEYMLNPANSIANKVEDFIICKVYKIGGDPCYYSDA